MTTSGPNAPLTVLGIETSCDETAASLVRLAADGSGKILSNVVRSQLDLHAVYGGVVPEIAARAHVDLIDAAIASRRSPKRGSASSESTASPRRQALA